MKLLNNGKAILIGLEEWKDEYFTSELRVVGCNCTGTDHLPVKEFEKRGIKFFSLKGFNFFLSSITSTAEHSVGLIIALMRNYKTALNAPYRDREFYIGHTLNGKTLGIIGGQGRVGKQLRGIMEDFGMNVIWVDKTGNYISLEELLKQSDVVSINIPLLGNEGFFTKEMFKMMKPTAIIINTSRDAVIQKGALLWALESGKIAGAGIDFIDDLDLLLYSQQHNNLILTNHQGGNTYEDRERTFNFIEQLVKNYLQDNATRNI